MKIIKALPIMIHKLTPMQTIYSSLLRDPQKSLIVCTGPAGTGKTSVVCRHAMEQLKERNIERLVITKHLVAVEGEDMGYLPGNIRSKMSPWIESYMDLFKEYYTANQIEDLLKKETIRLSPLAYCRGLTFTNSLVGWAARSTSRMTASSEMPRAFAVSAIWFSTRPVRT